MYSKETTVINPSGLHARPAAEFVAAAKRYRARISIQRSGEEDAVNAKSIVMLLSKAFTNGDCIRILAEGEDESAAVDALIALVEGGFGE